MKLVSYADGAGPRCGILEDGAIVDLPYPSWSAAFASWDAVRPDLDRALAARAVVRPLATARLLPPVRPSAIYCAAANYKDHFREMTAGREPPDRAKTRPYFFTKVPSTVIGPDEAIRLPATSAQVDWEAEIGVVIGRPCRGATLADALSHVAGYTIINDLSARDLSAREDWPLFGTDWFSGKSFDTSAPLGPAITLAEDVPDPHALFIKTWVNETLHQDSRSSEMLFSIEELIVSLSAQLTLQPGDLIATGTPAGCGRPRGIFLRPGDVVTIEIERLGVLRNPVL